MKKHKLALLFLLMCFVLFFINIAIIVFFSIVDMENNFYSSLNVASLSISFISFIVSSFFSLSVYIQTKNQNKINDTLPKKDDQYIIANYSLFNIENEVSFFSLTDEEKSAVLKRAKALACVGKPAEDSVTRLVFLPTESINQPTYKVLVQSISFFSPQHDELYTAKAPEKIDAEYSANILQRGYNCICVDISDSSDSLQASFSQSSYIKLSMDIISVFNVNMSVCFYIYLDSEKDVSQNPDKEKIGDLRTYKIHHANYTIEEKSIVSR